MIRLRELRRGDEGAVQRIYVPETVRYLGRGPMGADEARSFVESAVTAVGQSPRTRFALGVETAVGLVGVVKLRVVRDEGSLGYLLRPDAWGKGYATRAVSGLLALVQDVRPLTVVRAKHHQDNPASGRVLLKAGFSHIRTERGSALYEIRPAVCRRPGYSLVTPTEAG
ncbi:GNAT family N-acetyltransferase [Streptomyces sp. JNUCC 64]